MSNELTNKMESLCYGITAVTDLFTNKPYRTEPYTLKNIDLSWNEILKHKDLMISGSKLTRKFHSTEEDGFSYTVFCLVNQEMGGNSGPYSISLKIHFNKLMYVGIS